MTTPAPPKCSHWMLGEIPVGHKAEERETYHFAILVSFKTVEEYRAALRFMNPILEGEQ